MHAKARPVPMEVTDSELMIRLAAGDDLALNEIMTRWGQRVASFLYRMTGNPETAADLAQETFVKVYQARKRYHPDGRFSSYLFAIACNLARNHARWKQRHPAVSIDRDLETSSFAEVVDPGNTPEQIALSAERIRAVNNAFQALPADLRETMTLFIFEGLGYLEIGAVVGCSPKAVETRIYRARQFLKQQLKDIRA